MQVTLIQPDITWQDAGATCAHIRDLLADTAITPGGLIVLPEMFATGFSMEVDAVFEDASQHPGSDFLRELAVAHHAHVIGGVVTKNDVGRGLNQAVVIGPDGAEQLRYSKIHPFGFSKEPDHYDPGHEVLTGDVKANDAQTWRVTPLVCYDLRFPELFRIAAGHGSQMMAVIANWPASRIDHWTALLRARAIENQAYVAGVNRAGSDPNISYNGQSVLFNPKGHVIAQADDQPCVLQAELDLQQLTDYRGKFPALRDMKYPWQSSF